MKIDESTPFGARVIDRLTTNLIVWLTTIGASGTPYPKPIWFLWDGESILIFSQPGTPKLAHIAANPRVSINLNCDQYGNDVIVLTGNAVVDEDAPGANALPAYIEKYGEGMASIGMTPDQFAADYSVAIRVLPDKLSGH
jgi:PPOX class probable F420-dependent enzyme